MLLLGGCGWRSLLSMLARRGLALMRLQSSCPAAKLLRDPQLCRWSNSCGGRRPARTSAAVGLRQSVAAGDGSMAKGDLCLPLRLKTTFRRSSRRRSWRMDGASYSPRSGWLFALPRLRACCSSSRSTVWRRSGWQPCPNTSAMTGRGADRTPAGVCTLPHRGRKLGHKAQEPVADPQYGQQELGALAAHRACWSSSARRGRYAVRCGCNRCSPPCCWW